MFIMADKKASIIDFCNVVKTGRINLIENFIQKHGIPKSQTGVNEYLLLKSLLKNKSRNIAKLLINAGGRINATPSETGLTPLGLAFTYEYIDIAQLLVKRGATVYVDNSNKTTVLHLAAGMKSLKMLNFIFKHNASLNINIHSRDSNGKTAIQILLENHPFTTFDHKVGKNKIEMIRLLLQRGASVDFKSSNGRSALHYVIPVKEKDIIMSTLKKIKDVNLCDDQGRTALHYLLMSNYESENDVFDIVKLFIQKGAELDIADQHNNVTVAHVAADKKYLKVLNEFLQCQCEVSCKDSKGNTILHKLLECSAHLSGNKDYMNLVDSILSIAPLENVQNSSGKTLLHLAAANYHYQILEKMLLKCKNVNVSDWVHGETILHILAKQFSTENVTILKFLLNAGANVDMKNRCDVTPVDIALKIGNINLLILLLQRSKNLKQYYFQQKTVLHYLSSIQVDNESEELEIEKIARSCIKQGLNVDILDGLNRTPLCTAVFNRCKNLVNILLDCGANPNFSSSVDIIQYIAARSPLLNVDLEIADILVSKGATFNLTFKHLLFLLKHIDLHKSITKLLIHCENLNVLDLSGNTVLHAILENENYKDIVFPIFEAYLELFLSKGVSIYTKNKNNLTLIDLAAKNNHNSIYELLKKKSGAANVIQRIAGSAVQTAQLKKVKRKSVCTAGIEIECTPPKRAQRG